jgi:hypothetical protein
VFFATLDDIKLFGDTATLTVGVDLAVPEGPRAVKLCCCQAEDTWKRVLRGWVFVKRGLTICA